MKKYFIVFFISILLLSSTSFAGEISPGIASLKYNKFSRLKVAGFTMLGIGGPLLILGIIMAANGEWETVHTPTGVQKNAKDGKAAFGLIGICAGIPLSLAGVILGSVGAYKQKLYRRYINNASLNIKLSPKRQGISLTYNF